MSTNVDVDHPWSSCGLCDHLTWSPFYTTAAVHSIAPQTATVRAPKGERAPSSGVQTDDGGGGGGGVGFSGSGKTRRHRGRCTQTDALSG